MSENTDIPMQDVPEAPKPIQTASATTSPDNANSGNKAYVIAALALVLSLLLGFGISSCTRSLVLNKLHSLRTDGPLFGLDNNNEPLGITPYEDYDYFDDYKLYDDELYQDFGEDETTRDYGSGEVDSSYSSTISDEEAILELLDAVEMPIDDLLPASSYANTQNTISSFVREVVRADKSANTDLVGTLRSAAREADGRDEALKKALGIAEEAVKTLDSIEKPELANEDYLIDYDLTDGRRYAIRRWEEIQYAIELIKLGGDTDKRSFSQSLGFVLELTGDAAEDFENGLTSASR